MFEPWTNKFKRKICLCKDKAYQAKLKLRNNKEDEDEDEKKKKIRSNRTNLSEGKPLPYLDFLNKNIVCSKISKTFQLKYDGILKLKERTVLNSFKQKYIYYAIDDILYLFDSEPEEQEKLLSLLYTIMIYLHNNFSVNFLDIWIERIYINDIPSPNSFANSRYQNLKKTTYITVKVNYIIKPPAKKAEPVW